MSALSTAARNEYYGELEKSLPTPVINQPEYRERRLATAVEAFEALRPGDAYEGRLAVRIVLCGAYAAECLREADCYRDNYAKRTHCRAQAASMMRGENSAKRMLEREQRVRLAAEAVMGGAGAQPEGVSAPPPHDEPQAPPQAQAVAVSPVRAAAASSPSVETADAAALLTAVPPAVAAPRPAVPRAAPAEVGPGSAPPPSAEAIAQAEDFAMAAGVAAARIRHDRGITPQSKAYFHRVTLPSDPAVIDALVRGTTAALRVLDGVGCAMLEAAD